MPRLGVGDRVRFARSFVNRVQGGSSIGSLRGTVAELVPARELGASIIPARVRVQWDDSEGNPESAVASNIELA